jgi:hypothetical protein
MKQPAHPVAKELKAQIDAALAASELEIARARQALLKAAYIDYMSERVGRTSSER